MTATPGRSWRTALVIGALGLVGPCVRLAIPPGSSVESFIYDLTWLLWPTQAVAVAEVTLGRAAARALAVGANLLLFFAIGMIIGLTNHKSLARHALQAILIGAVLLWTAIGAGFDAAFVNWLALLVACGMGALAFWLAARVGAPGKAHVSR